MMRKLIALAAVLALAGCAAGPATTSTGAVATQADAGPAPTDAEWVMQSALRMHLKDPDSARVQGVVGPTFMAIDGTTYSPPMYGWWVCADVNAKNSFGGYTGYTKKLAVYRGGQIVHIDYERTDWPHRSMWVREVCAQAAAPAAG